MNKTILTTALVTFGTLLFATTALGDYTQIRRDYELRRIDLEQDYKARREANKYAYHRERDALEAARRRANRIDCRDTRAIRVRAINRDLSALSRNYHAKNRAISAWYNNGRDSLRTSYEVAKRTVRRTAARPVGIGVGGIGVNIFDTVVERPHPADCSCNVCVPVEREVVIERPIVEPRPVYTRPIYTRPAPRPVIVDRPVIEVPAPIVRPHAHPADCDCHICEPPPVDTCPSRGGFDYGVERGYGDVSFGRDRVPASYGRNPNSLDWADLIFSLVR